LSAEAVAVVAPDLGKQAVLGRHGPGASPKDPRSQTYPLQCTETLG